MKQTREKAADMQISITDRPEIQLVKKTYKGLEMYFAKEDRQMDRKHRERWHSREVHIKIRT